MSPCLQEVAVKNTPLFLRYLTDQMHERVPGSLVLWYDSVIQTGHLQWQNELNESNRWRTEPDANTLVSHSNVPVKTTKMIRTVVDCFSISP